MDNVAMQQRVADFLAQKRVAVLGVSHSQDNTGTGILRKFLTHGKVAFGVNPTGGAVDGAPLYPHVADIPGGVDAAVLVVHPKDALAAVKDCEAAGVTRLWFHDNTWMTGSSSAPALEYAEARGMIVIPNGCPMMHLEPDVAHACMHWVLQKTGRLEM